MTALQTKMSLGHQVRCWRHLQFHRRVGSIDKPQWALWRGEVAVLPTTNKSMNKGTNALWQEPTHTCGLLTPVMPRSRRGKQKWNLESDIIALPFTSNQHQLCSLGQDTRPLWASVSSPLNNSAQVYLPHRFILKFKCDNKCESTLCIFSCFHYA